MKDLLELNEITDIKFKNVVSIRNAFLQKLKVFDQVGNYLEDINVDVDAETSDTEVDKVAKLDKHNVVSCKLSKGQKKVLLEHMTKNKVFFYTIDTYNGDLVLKSKLSKQSKKLIRNFFAKEQNMIDMMTSTDSADEEDDVMDNIIGSPGKNKVDMSDDSDNSDEECSDSEDDENDSDNDSDDYSGVFGNTGGKKNHQNVKKRKKSNSDSSESMVQTRSKKQCVPSTPPPSKAMLLVSPKVQKGKKKSLTPNKANKSKSDFSKVSVHVSVKAPKKVNQEDGTYFLIIETENGQGENLFAWRPKFLKEVFECFQEDYEPGDYWRENVSFLCIEQCDSPNSEMQKLNSKGYGVNLIAIQLEVTEDILRKVIPDEDDGISAEHIFIKTMFDCFWKNMVNDKSFEPRLVNCIEKTLLPPNHNFDETYPRKSVTSYVSPVVRCLAKDKSKKKKRSDNFEKLENPQFDFHFNVPLGDFMLGPQVKEICSELKLKRKSKKEKEVFEKFTGFTA